MELELWVLLRLFVSALLSGLIGYEREQTGKEAGLRTHMLVAVGSTLFLSFNDFYNSMYLERGNAPLPGGRYADPGRAVQAIATGIGFIGAGTIFFSGHKDRIRGLTTAASIWVTAAIGAAVAIDRYIVAAGGTILVLFILRVLGRIDVHRQKRVLPGQVGSAGMLLEDD